MRKSYVLWFVITYLWFFGLFTVGYAFGEVAVPYQPPVVLRGQESIQIVCYGDEILSVQVSDDGQKVINTVTCRQWVTPTD